MEIYSYYKDEIYDSANETNNDCNKVNNGKTIRRKSLNIRQK